MEFDLIIDIGSRCSSAVNPDEAYEYPKQVDDRKSWIKSICGIEGDNTCEYNAKSFMPE